MRGRLVEQWSNFPLNGSNTGQIRVRCEVSPRQTDAPRPAAASRPLSRCLRRGVLVTESPHSLINCIHLIIAAPASRCARAPFAPAAAGGVSSRRRGGPDQRSLPQPSLIVFIRLALPGPGPRAGRHSVRTRISGTVQIRIPSLVQPPPIAAMRREGFTLHLIYT
jgi:hypothetical protein